VKSLTEFEVKKIKETTSIFIGEKVRKLRGIKQC
jgi:hypothetical protein